MKINKKPIAILLSLLILIAGAAPSGITAFLLPYASAANIVESGKCGDDVTYTLDSAGLLTISGTGKMNDYSFKGSLFYNNLSVKKLVINQGVTSIGHYAFEECAGLTAITIPDSVTSIGIRAFYNCTGFTGITIPDSVTSIGTYAFTGCAGLKNLTIPAGVTSIGSYAFKGCSGLGTIKVSAGNEKYHSSGNCLIETSGKKLITGCKNSVIPSDGSVTSIGYEAFYGCAGLTSITIPNGVTSIGESAFYGCEGLTSITIPDSVTSIGYSAFRGCKGLTFIRIPYGVTTIGDSVFAACCNLRSISLPDSLTSIGEYAFSGCADLIDITLPDSVTSIGTFAFWDCASITSLTLPAVMTSIGEHAFDGCTSLMDITLQAGMTSIIDHAFDGCKGLISITLPEGVTSIGSYAFYGCEGLKNITIPGSVKSIGSYAFERCKSLTGITIPKGVTSIKNGVFMNCEGLTGITIPKSVTSIGDCAFKGCDALKNITIPDSVTSIGEKAFEGCKSLTDITIPTGVTSIEEGMLYYCSGLKSVTIPDSVTSIADFAFYGCAGLTSIMIPDSVTSIGKYAFCNSGLTSITIPDSVASIGEAAFGGSVYLKGIMLSDSITTISGSTFLLCANLTSIMIPDGVTSIDNLAFSGCTRLTRAAIPASVTSIGYGAFDGCAALADVYYAGSESDWAEIAIANGNECLTGAVMHYNSDVSLTQNGDLVTFGSYPQTRVTDPSLLSALNSKTLDWKYYDYYAGGVQEDYMEYADTIVNGVGYRGVRFSHYRPYDTGASTLTTASESFQDDNGYDSGTVYWFRFEPVVWRVLDAGEGLVMTDSVVDSQPFENYWPGYEQTLYGGDGNEHFSSDWAYSSLRAWLNNDFYNTVFTDYEKSCILETYLTTPSGIAAEYDAAPSSDRVFLLSKEDVQDRFSCDWTADGTDYAKSQGLLTENGGVFCWTLRTPEYAYNMDAVARNGEVFDDCDTCDTYCGTRPVIKINLLEALLAQDDAPRIINQPSDAKKAVGETAAFTVGAIGTGPLSYQWQSSANGGNTWKNSGFSTAKTAALEVPVTAARDGSLYRCVITGAEDSVTSAAVALTVATAVTAQPKSVAKTVGETAEFTVEASGVAPFAYRWQASADGGKTWKNSSFSTANTATLKVPVTAARDGSKYRCRVEGANGQYEFSSGATLTVKAAATEITAQPASVTKAVGETAAFAVTAAGAELAYQWQSSANGGKTWKNSGFSTAKTAALEVPVTAARDGSLYRCVVTGANGSVTSSAAGLTVATKITAQPASVSLPIGETAAFTVNVTGVDLTYKWQYSANGGRNWSNSGFSTAKTATLKVPVTEARDGCLYRCVVTGANGSVTSSAAALTVATKITSQPAAVTKALGETASFTVSATGVDLNYKWQCSTNGGRNWGNSGFSTAKTATLKVPVTEARDGYMFRCVVTGANGSVTSDAAALTVSAKITSQPASVTKALGETATFTVNATGIDLTYKWQCSTNGGKSWSNSGFSTAKTATLSVPVTAARDGYMFRCVVTGYNGQTATTKAVKLTVS